MIFSRFIHVVVGIITFFFFIAEYYSIVWIAHILFIHSQADGDLHCFLFGAVIKNEHGGFEAQRDKWQTQVGF